MGWGKHSIQGSKKPPCTHLPTSNPPTPAPQSAIPTENPHHVFTRWITIKTKQGTRVCEPATSWPNEFSPTAYFACPNAARTPRLTASSLSPNMIAACGSRPHIPASRTALSRDLCAALSRDLFPARLLHLLLDLRETLIHRCVLLQEAFVRSENKIFRLLVHLIPFALHHRWNDCELANVHV